MGRLHNKLRRLQEPLRQWNRRVIGDLPIRVAKAHEQLLQLMEWEQHVTPDCRHVNRLEATFKNFEALQRQLEIFWAQRARVQWVCEGDRNSKFFHTKLQRRRTRNRITEILTMQGQKLEDSEEIRSHALEYFSEHWASKIEQLTIVPIDLIPQRVPDDMVDDLIRPFSMLEIEEQRRSNVLEVVNRRLQGWKGQMLSLAGRCVLIQSVLNAVPQHFMASAAMPASTTRDVEQVARSFLWHGTSSSSKLHLISWEAVSRSKANGGLGIRRISLLREAVLGMIAFRFLLNPSVATHFFALKYRWNGNPWEVMESQKSSAVWKALCHGIKLIRQFIRKLPEYWVNLILRTEPPKCNTSGQPSWCWDGSTGMTPRARDLYLLRQPVIPNAQAKYWKQIWALPVYPKTASTKSDMESRELAASIIWGGLEKCPKSNTQTGVDGLCMARGVFAPGKEATGA
ncbi:hypothetical protein QJS10_CPA01g00703 [Acorus calamus]|uniref:Reverse transcriptase n=1 Tax=Acorus calamus TaxID=4465 RepID=A0AAV9FF25_ACOCL|nr:hypothetical protein QJS10_CPA01g00703 [Acorus calamus]